MILLFFACTPAPEPHLQAEAVADGIALHSTLPLSDIRILDESGNQKFRRQLAASTTEVLIPINLPPGVWQIVAGTQSASLHILPTAPLRVEVLQQGRWMDAENEIEIPVFEGKSSEVVVGLSLGPEGTPNVVVEPGGPVVIDTQRTLLRYTVGEQPIEVRFSAGSYQKSLRLVPRMQSLEQQKAQIQVRDVEFPTDAEGKPDPTRSSFQVYFPGWEPGWFRSGRRQDEEAPYAYYSINLENTGKEDQDLLLNLSIEDPAFYPRLRGARTEKGEVTALLRVPAGKKAYATMPVYVDRALVTDASYPTVLRIFPAGAEEPLQEIRRDLQVQKGDLWSVVGMMLTMGVGVVADGWAALRLGTWLERTPTSELMSIAMVGSALFVVGGANDLLTVSIAALLGPFAPLLTALLGDVGRIVLLGTLLGLMPRPGTLSLAIVSGWLLRGLALGGFSVLDVFSIGSSIAFGEGFSWIAGTSRVSGWTEESPFRRWVRLSLAFGGASLAGTLSGFWMQMVVYRLYYASWYLLLQAIVIGLLYPILASRIASRLIGHLLRVAP